MRDLYMMEKNIDYPILIVLTIYHSNTFATIEIDLMIIIGPTNYLIKWPNPSICAPP